MQLAARVAEQPAGDVVLARSQLHRHLRREAGRDVLALLDDHHAIEDFPLQRAIGLVDDGEGGAPRRHGDVVGLRIS